MKAIHNYNTFPTIPLNVVLYPKDTEKWKQFTTNFGTKPPSGRLFCIPKILKNESNSQLGILLPLWSNSCFVSQRYWKMKAIHNFFFHIPTKEFVVLYPKDTEKWKQFTTSLAFQKIFLKVVLYPKDTEKWKQFTTVKLSCPTKFALFCIPKILKNESNSQL